MFVSAIWQYPVKSMAGHIVPSASVTPEGMVGDRAWAVRDEQRGGIRGAKKIGQLMLCSAAHDGDGRVAITLPDGTTVSSADPRVDSRVSAGLGHPVTLWPLQPADALDHYRRGAPDSDDIMVELRTMFGRTDDEPLPDLSVFPPVIMEYESPPGTYLDAFPLLLMTTSALRALEEALPSSVIDVRRFRPNLVIDTGEEAGHPEFGWVGRTVRIGAIELKVETPCPRCIMVTRPIDDRIGEDRAVLRHIVRDLDQFVGVYATPLTSGTIETGAPVTIE